MKKLCLLLLALAFILSLAACGDPQADGDGTEPGGIPTPDNAPPTLTETVIYDQGNIKITVTGLNTEATFGPEMGLTIENKTESTLTVQTDRTSVNGYMIRTYLSAEVTPSGISVATVTFDRAELALAEITVMKDIELYLNLTKADVPDEVTRSGAIKLTTSAAGHVQSNDLPGTALYDGQGIRIIYLPDKTDGQTLYFYMENNSEKTVTVSPGATTVADQEVTPTGTVTLSAGKKAIGAVAFPSEVADLLGKNDVTVSFELLPEDQQTPITTPATILKPHS